MSVEQEMSAEWGGRCPVYNTHCFQCRAWKRFYDTGEVPSWGEVPGRPEESPAECEWSEIAGEQA